MKGRSLYIQKTQLSQSRINLEKFIMRGNQIVGHQGQRERSDSDNKKEVISHGPRIHRLTVNFSSETMEDRGCKVIPFKC
jgi:hypothetical protein